MQQHAPSGSRAYEPWKRIGTDLYRRRYELFALAAPVFRQHGYRGATIQALAHACHLSPAGLYHYFGSKRELATYLLTAPRLRWETVYVDGSTDPLVQLRAAVEIAIRNVPLYLLCLQMLEELEGSVAPEVRGAAFREGESLFGRLITECAPEVPRDAAIAASRDIIAVLIGSAYAKLDPAPGDAVRTRSIEVLRRTLVASSVDADRFDRIMAQDGDENRRNRAIPPVLRDVGLQYT